MDKETQEKKPYYSIFLDLVKHPHFAENQELALFTADFIYQNGYHKLPEGQPPNVIDSIDEYYQRYLPKYAKKYPVTMRVTEIEERYLKFRRG